MILTNNISHIPWSFIIIFYKSAGPNEQKDFLLYNIGYIPWCIIMILTNNISHIPWCIIMIFYQSAQRLPRWPRKAKEK
jgi:hypothetical protein